MKIAVIGSGTFIGKNLIENLKNIRDGKNRTRPEFEISEINLDEVKDADTVILLPSGASKDVLADKSMPGDSPADAPSDVLSDVQSKESLHRNVLAEIQSGSTAVSKAIRVLYNDFEKFGTCIDKDPEFSKLPCDTFTYHVPMIVGKWQEPDSGVAYLCRAVANDEDISAVDKDEPLDILFIDDFVEEMLNALEGKPHGCEGVKDCMSQNKPSCCTCSGVTDTTVGEVIDLLESFNRMNTTLVVPEIPAGSFAYKLFSMYLSFLPQSKMSYPVKMNVDNRGVFSELVKTVNNGQVSINIARPGNVRGQHWHNTKWEIFIVVSGHGLIQQRQIGTDKVYNFEVRGEEMRAVIMLPGYTHNIINLEDDRDLVTVMFANEQFDPDHPDTFFEVVE